jgi:hypothetical protein
MLLCGESIFPHVKAFPNFPCASLFDPGNLGGSCQIPKLVSEFLQAFFMADFQFHSVVVDLDTFPQKPMS